MTAEKASWCCLPGEIRIMILEVLQEGCSLAGFATVSREWQTIIERHNFARVKLTRHALSNLVRLLDPAVIRGHGDAIHHLKLLTPVIRPVSLWQIQMEHMVREGHITDD
jgi:hypothetical protein